VLGSQLSERQLRLAGATLLLASVAALLLMGVLGVGRTSPRFQDFGFFYSGGALWLEGRSPYDPARFAEKFRQVSGLPDFDRVFPYPPMIAPFCMALALLPYGAAVLAMLLMNAVAVGCLALLTIRLVARDGEATRPRDWALHACLLASIVVANPFTMRTVWVAQITLAVSVAVIAAWHFANRRRELLAGVVLGLASIKPQFAILPSLWLLLDRRWKTLSVAALVASVLAAFPLALDGPIPLLRDWFHSMALFQDQEIDHVGSPIVIGLPSVLAAAGLGEIPAMLALVGGMAGVLALWTQRRRLCSDDLLALVLAIQVGLVWAHESDLMILAPLLGACWLHLGPRPRGLLGPALLLALLCLPSRLVGLLGLPLLMHWKTGVVVVALFSLLVLSYRAARARQAGFDPTRDGLAEQALLQRTAGSR
jgi:hypothetical protein